MEFWVKVVCSFKILINIVKTVYAASRHERACFPISLPIQSVIKLNDVCQWYLIIFSFAFLFWLRMSIFPNCQELPMLLFLWTVLCLFFSWMIDFLIIDFLGALYILKKQVLCQQYKEKGFPLPYSLTLVFWLCRELNILYVVKCINLIFYSPWVCL